MLKGCEHLRNREPGVVMLVTLEQAVALLDQGQLVAIPTETVYGLAADPASDDALTLLYRSKGRPHDHPVILHVLDVDMCRAYVREIPKAALALMHAFWPGPVTFLLPRSHRVSDRVTGGRPVVGVRAPDAPLARKVLARLGRPVAAPSANRFGHISPTTAAHVEEEFEGRVAVLDGGPCQVGLESTILQVEPERVRVLRPGGLSHQRLQAACPIPLFYPDDVQGVPGALRSHYAPRQPVVIMSPESLREIPGRGAAILTLSEGSWPEATAVYRLPTEAGAYGQALYATLRQAEGCGCLRILIERPPPDWEWMAVHDRLSRAAAAE
jgi:L-threonylcarbamoyladenylate synthase